VDATVRAIFIKPKKGARPVPLQSVLAIDGGLEGDYHTGSVRRRQVLLISGATLAEFDLNPGSISENMVIDGLDVMGLSEGQQLRIGDALVEVTTPCEPCTKMDRVRYGLQDQLQSCRGMFVRVLEPGTVRTGDSVETVGVCP